jgi:signal transduction histidine kinase
MQLEAVGVTVQIRVCDTGAGIAPAHVPHVFDRFYRTDKARARDKGGTGLGLAIVNAIAQAHGGSVVVESEGLGKGSTFTMQLPLEREG